MTSHRLEKCNCPPRTLRTCTPSVPAHASARDSIFPAVLSSLNSCQNYRCHDNRKLDVTSAAVGSHGRDWYPADCPPGTSCRGSFPAGRSRSLHRRPLNNTAVASPPSTTHVLVAPLCGWASAEADLARLRRIPLYRDLQVNPAGLCRHRSTSGAGLPSLLRTTFRLVGLLGVPLTSSTAFLCHFSASLTRRTTLLLHPLKFQPAPIQCALTFTPPHVSLLALPCC